MSDGLKWFLGALGLVMLGLIGTHGQTPLGSARNAEALLETRANGVLEARRHGENVVVRMDGQKAYLSGVFPDQSALDRARADVLASTWSGGERVGGVTRLENENVAIRAPRQDAYAWSAVADAERIVLSGLAPTDTARRFLVERARLAFAPRVVIDQMEVDEEAPAAEWLGVASLGLDALAALAEGEARLTDRRPEGTASQGAAAWLSVRGEAADAQARTDALRLLGAVVPPFARGAVAVTTRPPPPAPDPTPPLPLLRDAAPDPDLDAEDGEVALGDDAALEPEPPADAEPPAPDEAIDTAAEEAPQEPAPEPASEPAPPALAALPPAARETRLAEALQCQDRFDDALVDQRFEFESNSAVLPQAELAKLAPLVEIALACPDAALTIAGHTDSTGETAFNQQLSADRAYTVLEYFTANGVSVDRLSVVGFGDTRPIAPNTTRDGRARNRRIEIAVSP